MVKGYLLIFPHVSFNPTVRLKISFSANYEEAKAENRQLYLDADQLADIADWYASERKFEEAQEAITYGLKIHPGNTALLGCEGHIFFIFGITRFSSVEPFFGCVRISHVQIEK